MTTDQVVTNFEAVGEIECERGHVFVLYVAHNPLVSDHVRRVVARCPECANEDAT